MSAKVAALWIKFDSTVWDTVLHGCLGLICTECLLRSSWIYYCTIPVDIKGSTCIWSNRRWSLAFATCLWSTLAPQWRLVSQAVGWMAHRQWVSGSICPVIRPQLPGGNGSAVIWVQTSRPIHRYLLATTTMIPGCQCCVFSLTKPGPNLLPWAPSVLHHNTWKWSQEIRRIQTRDEACVITTCIFPIFLETHRAKTKS